MSTPDWTHNETIRASLARHIETAELTHGEAARLLGFTTSRVTKYLNLNEPAPDGSARKPEPDMARVEAAAKRLLNHAARREAHKHTLFENSVSTQVDTVLRTVRRTGDIGLIHGPAGLGKSCGAEIYCNANPNSLFLTIREYACGSGAVESMLFLQHIESSTEKWPGNVRRMVWLEQQMRGSDRLIIVDNAHQMHPTAYRLLFNFHDATGVPIGLIGNPEVLRVVRSSDQLFSRIGHVSAVRVLNDSELIARRMTLQYAPESGDALIPLATDVVNQFGHSRSLRKQLTLAVDIHAGAATKAKPITWPTAFELAGTKLLKAN